MDKREKEILEYGDKVFASLSVGTSTIASISNDKNHNIDDIISQLRSIAKHYTGLAHLSIRNATRGWSLQRTLVLCKSLMQLRTKEEMISNGYCDRCGQLLIQF